MLDRYALWQAIGADPQMSERPDGEFVYYDDMLCVLRSDEAVDRVADVLAIEITGLDYALLEYDRQDEQWDQRTMRKIARAAIAALIGEGE